MSAFSGTIIGCALGREPAQQRKAISLMFVQITLASQTADHVERFERAVQMHPEIQECFAVIGSADYQLRIGATNIAQYEALHRSVLSRLPGVRNIRLNVPIRRVVTAG